MLRPEKTDGLTQFNPCHWVDKKLRAYEHPKLVRKIPLNVHVLQKLKIGVTYYLHLRNDKIMPIDDLKHV